MDFDLLKVIITIALAVLGWVTGHWLNLSRSRVLKRRELKTQYLIDVYRKLDNFISCLVAGSSSKEAISDINSVITDIQLFGSQEQIDMAVKITKVLALDKQVPTEELSNLVQDLRNELRSELSLTKVNTKVAYLNARYEA